jgi:hypothetical protein
MLAERTIFESINLIVHKVTIALEKVKTIVAIKAADSVT